MGLVVKEKTISAGAAEIWATIADIDQLDCWLPGVETAVCLGAQRNGIGRRQRVVLTGQPGRWSQEQVVIVWEPARRFGWRVLSSQLRGRPLNDVSDLQTLITLDAQDGRTRVQIETSWLPTGLKGRLIGRLALQPALRRQLAGALLQLEALAQGKGKT